MVSFIKPFNITNLSVICQVIIFSFPALNNTEENAKQTQGQLQVCHHMQTPSHGNRTCSYFLLDLGVGVTELASLRGRPRGCLSEGAGLPEGVAPALLRGGDGPCSEGSRLLSSDDILYKDKTRPYITCVSMTRV